MQDCLLFNYHSSPSSKVQRLISLDIIYYYAITPYAPLVCPLARTPANALFGFRVKEE